MNPVAFNLFGLDIMWYGIFISFGIFIALLLAKYNCKYRNVCFDTLLNIFIISLPLAIVGARLYYVLFEFTSYRNNFMEMINIRNGGLAIHGGLIFGIISAIVYCRIKNIDFINYIDTAAPSIIIAQSIGRWGNFFNSEAHGGEVSLEFISHFPKFIQRGMLINGVYYNPTFLYESLWNILVAIILIQLLKKLKDGRGVVIFTYIGLYSIGRYFIEGLRTDSLMILNIRIAQLISFTGILAWLLFLVFKYFIKKRGR